MKKAIAFQVMIFIIAWFVMTPDQLVDETYLFGLFGSYDVIRGNAHWVLAGAAILSVVNIWVWWPKAAAKQTAEKPIADETKSETKAEDPVVPKMD